MADEKEEKQNVLPSEIPNAIELHFAGKDEVIEDRLGDKKVIWKDILSEGRIEIAPVPGAAKRPFIVTATGRSDPSNLKVSMADLMQSYRDTAFKYVKTPMGHPKKGVDIASINTGFVEGLRVVKKRGKSYLQGALGFTEPDVAGKVGRGTIPDVSSGILFNFTRKKDGKTFPAALHHVALTGDPIDTDLDRFKCVYASDDEVNLSDEEIVVAFAQFADEPAAEEDATKADLVWNEQDGANWVREELQQALNPDGDGESFPSDGRPVQPRPHFYVEDISQSKNLAVANMYFKGDRTRWVIPFTVSDGKVSAGPEFRWTEAKEALVAASEDFSVKSSGKVKEGIKKALVAMLGEDGKKYKVDEVSLDNHALIRDSSNIFVADFALLSDGEIFVAPPGDWDKKAELTKPKAMKVVNLYDESTPEGRVRAARQRRRTTISKTV